MGILERTRALLVSQLGLRIEDSGADVRALKDLILELEKARADILQGLEALRREVGWLEEQPKSEDRDSDLDDIQGDILEGEEELRRVVEGTSQAQAALQAAAKRQ